MSRQQRDRELRGCISCLQFTNTGTDSVLVAHIDNAGHTAGHFTKVREGQSWRHSQAVHDTLSSMELKVRQVSQLISLDGDER